MSEQAPAQRNAIEIRTANVDLGTKLDAVGAALVAIREAHRDAMPVKCWAAINRARSDRGSHFGGAMNFPNRPQTRRRR